MPTAGELAGSPRRRRRRWTRHPRGRRGERPARRGGGWGPRRTGWTASGCTAGSEAERGTSPTSSRTDRFWEEGGRTERWFFVVSKGGPRCEAHERLRDDGYDIRCRLRLRAATRGGDRWSRVFPRITRPVPIERSDVTFLSAVVAPHFGSNKEPSRRFRVRFSFSWRERVDRVFRSRSVVRDVEERPRKGGGVARRERQAELPLDHGDHELERPPVSPGG